MRYLASAADILAGSEGKQRRSRWARLGSDFQMGFFVVAASACFCTLVTPETQGERPLLPSEP